ncbi:MAG: 3-phosphoshikimate 1-carboxyvinyltransferase [Acidimicrobiales bacterium]
MSEEGTDRAGDAPVLPDTVLPDTVRIDGGTALTGELRVPGDKSISHRALILGALAEGTTVVHGLSTGDDVRRTLAAVRRLGAAVEEPDGPGGVTYVHGGRSRLHAAEGSIDCGNSGTGLRLLAGLVAGLDGKTILTGDESLSERPMDRIAAPLGAMGATVSGRGARCLPPVTVAGGRLHAITCTPPVASAQVKSAVLLAGLSAEGETVVHESVRTRTHTEELLALAGAEISVTDEGPRRTVRLRASALSPFDLTVPGDPSQAAFWLVGACVVPGSEVTVRDVYAGGERVGYLGVLARMGARVELASRPGGAVDVTARYGPLTGTVVEAAEVPSLDEVPVLAVAAACARGTTCFRDVSELRVKESDRLEAIVRLLTAAGADVDVDGDDLVVHGTAGRLGDEAAGLCSLEAFVAHSGGDHRIAMAAIVAALAARGASRVEGFGCVATSYTTFLDDLRALGASPRTLLLAIDGPAGSGKSTVSRALSRRLGIPRLDTGAMYRAIAWAALARGVDPEDAEAVSAIARAATIEVETEMVRMDGVDVTHEIRTAAVNRAVSVVAAIPAVRAALVERQRRWVARHGGGVVEGRDIGTVVFPGADVKVYLTASREERARRRHDEAAEGVARRDHIDSTRTASPLVRADDARLLDTTGRSVQTVVEEILSWT